MKGSIKIILGLIIFVLGAILIVYGPSTWSLVKQKIKKAEVIEDSRVKGPTGPPSVKGPTGPPPQ